MLGSNIMSMKMRIVMQRLLQVITGLFVIVNIYGTFVELKYSSELMSAMLMFALLTVLVKRSNERFKANTNK